MIDFGLLVFNNGKFYEKDPSGGGRGPDLYPLSDGDLRELAEGIRDLFVDTGIKLWVHAVDQETEERILGHKCSCETSSGT